ncbi:MAG: GNAT family N-acyltransferase [Candidatus Binataceae bacterium]|jgi:putative hemolysin
MLDAESRELLALWTDDDRRVRFVTEVAAGPDEVLDAMRLRHRVFVGEMKAAATSGGVEIECDRFDRYCDHLIVRDAIHGRVVGAYRMLGCEGARAAGGFYSETEFDLHPLKQLRGRILEVGRACVDPDYRGGAVISLLWAGLFKYIITRNYDYVIGCGSISLADGGQAAAAICKRLLRDHLCDPHLRVTPHRAFRLDEFAGSLETPVPPLIKGYLRVGASVCGEPAWDAGFNTADMLIMLPTARMNPRYFGRYVRQV